MFSFVNEKTQPVIASIGAAYGAAAATSLTSAKSAATKSSRGEPSPASQVRLRFRCLLLTFFYRYNRIVYAAPLRGLASATARSFRYAPFPRRCSGTFFCALKPLRGFFIGRKKTSQDTRNVMRNLKNCL
jgi:hypothetical protein